MQDELSAGLTSLGSDGEAVMQAPSFREASKSFEAARDSTRQQQQQETDGQQQQEAAGGAAGTQEGSNGQQELVRLLFAKYNPTSTNYTGLDVDVVLRLSTLVFYCNRPTVAALMVFGTDLGAVNTLLAAPADETHVRPLDMRQLSFSWALFKRCAGNPSNRVATGGLTTADLPLNCQLTVFVAVACWRGAGPELWAGCCWRQRHHRERVGQRRAAAAVWR
jgi:hypothetical protein